MNKKITCKQVQAILPFYLKGRTNPEINELIENHLINCKTCKEIYLRAINEETSFALVDDEIELSEVDVDDNRFVTKEYANFKKKLSAYLDSELEDSENIKIKKMTISNPLARKDLEDMYLFKRLLHSSFQRTKENCKYDFSKNIIKRLDDSSFYHTDFFVKIGMILLVLSVILSISFFTNT